MTSLSAKQISPCLCMWQWKMLNSALAKGPLRRTHCANCSDTNLELACKTPVAIALRISNASGNKLTLPENKHMICPEADKWLQRAFLPHSHCNRKWFPVIMKWREGLGKPWGDRCINMGELMLHEWRFEKICWLPSCRLRQLHNVSAILGLIQDAIKASVQKQTNKNTTKLSLLPTPRHLFRNLPSNGLAPKANSAVLSWSKEICFPTSSLKLHFIWLPWWCRLRYNFHAVKDTDLKYLTWWTLLMCTPMEGPLRAEYALAISPKALSFCQHSSRFIIATVWILHVS